jgi:hypothetical protein
MIRSVLCWSIACALVLEPLSAQAPQPSNLTLTVVEGEAAINNLTRRAARELSVKVTDSSQQAIEKAMVVFALPDTGPSGTFSGGGTTATVPTNKQGIASVRFQPNSVDGKVEIRVSVTQQGETARTTITEFNMAVPVTKTEKKSGNGKIVAILAVAAAAAAGGVVAATRGGSSSPTPTTPPPAGPTLTVTPGTGTVGPPQ